ncbi:MAG: C40 family peptidase [Candidatus Zixiibacteriota bacterium]|nr:MAG: C40 family peptidase [candidate division Zixibacteria bacterium]
MRKSILCFLPVLLFFAACSGPVKDPEYDRPARPLHGTDAKKLLTGAAKHIGEPYKYGGVSPEGWDCSGFVRGMFKKYLGLNLPRETDGLYSASFPVKGENTRPGDLVFFRIDSGKPSHVGIYAGNGRFIHSSTSSGVIVSSLAEDYYRQRFTGFRRIRNGFLANSR